MTIGENLDKLYDLRAQKDALQAQLSDINKEIDGLEYDLLMEMERLGLDNAKSTKGSAYRKVELYPQVKDMEAFVNWAAENGKTDMLQKRVNAASFKEHYEQTGEYPDGLDAYQRSSLTFRRAR